MKETKYDIRQLDEDSFSMIKELFFSVFTEEPWNDDWSDEDQLQLYIHDLIGQNNSLTFGLYEGKRVGRHLYGPHKTLVFRHGILY